MYVVNAFSLYFTNKFANYFPRTAMDSNPSDSDIPQLIHKLKNWPKEPKHIITQILTRIHTTLTWNQTEQNLNQLLQVLKPFHIEINKAQNAQQIEHEWFQHVIKGKDHIKRLLEEQKKPRFASRRIQVRYGEIKIPEMGNQEKAIQYNLVFELLYKSFIMNLKQTLTKETTKIKDFIDKVIKQLSDDFNFNKQKANGTQSKTVKLFDRLEQIQKKWKCKSSSLAKEQMLEGSISVLDAARCNPIVFHEEEVKRRRKKRQKETLKASN